MDGIETTKRLRESGYTGFIIALTANAVSGQSDLFLQNGFDDFISKPIDVRRLDAVLNKFIRDNHPAEVVEAARTDLCEKLLELKERCADYDRKGALDIIESIAGCGAETKTVLDTISEYVRHSDFEEAESAVGEYRARLFPDAAPGGEPYGLVVRRFLDKGIEGLNVRRGLERYDDDENTYLKILRSYVGSVRSVLAVIQPFDEAKLDDYAIRVHGIKGASFDVFAETVGAEAKALEMAARSEDIAYIQARNEDFIEKCGALLGRIEGMLDAVSKANPKPKKDRPDTALLLQLIDACGEYSMKRAEAAMTEIEKYQYEEDGGLAEWLRHNIDMMNFPQIVEMLEKYTQNG
jgi:CheY-like chemotaxis protein